jgi:outer membrane receptor protein involved in Fe transport
MIVARALKNSQLIRPRPDERHAYFGNRTLSRYEQHRQQGVQLGNDNRQGRTLLETRSTRFAHPPINTLAIALTNQINLVFGTAREPKLKMIRISKAFRQAALALVFSLTPLGAIHVQAQTTDQPAPPTQSITLKPIIVTGYLVPRVGGEGAQPVETLTRNFIDRQGDQTVADVIFRLPENVGSFSPLVTPGGTTTPSASAANLQGLGVNSTLVLIDGHRQTPFPFPNGGFQAFVDLNSIPLAAVDRIEILKDGASALYGSDAIAGVINVILKNEYQGADISSYYGISQRGDDEVWHVQLTSGISHSFNENSKFSIVGAFDFYENSPIDSKDRSYSSNLNHSIRGPDLRDLRSQLAPAGSFLGLASGNRYTVIPGSVGPFLNPGTDFFVNGPPNRFSFVPGTQLLPREQRIGGYLKAQYQLNQYVGFYDELMLQRDKENASAAVVPISPTDHITVPANNPFNPFGKPLQWVGGRPFNFGFRHFITEVDTIRNIVGINLINLPQNWFVNPSFLYAESDGETKSFGSPLKSALNEALAGTLPGLEGQFFNPFPDSSVAKNLNANFTAPLQYTQDHHARTDLTIWEIRSGGELFDLPGGPITLGLGAEYRSDGYVDYKDINSRLGNIIGTGGSPNQSGKDYDRAAYEELTIPVFGGHWSWPGARLLEIVLAERYDDYSSFGEAWKPKISLRYKPFDDLTFRASYSEGFRAPSLPELFKAHITTFTFITDPTRPPGFPATYEVETISGGNPNLRPETSYAYYAGLIWTPGHSDPEHSWWGWADGLTIYGDWTEILKRNVISPVDNQFVVDNPQLFPGNVIRGAGGQIVTVLSPFENLGAIKVDSFSFGGSYSSKEYNWGKIDLAVDATYFYHVSQQKVPNGQVLNFTDTFGMPDFKLTASIFYSKHLPCGDRFQTGLTLNFIDSEHDVNDFNTVGLTLQEFVAQTGLSQVHTVGNWTTLDWQISHEFGQPEEIAPETTPGYDKEDKKAGGSKPVQIGPPNSAWRNWVAGTKVTFGINNIFDTNPPFADIVQGYDTQVANPIGRFFYVQLEKKF